MDYSFCYRQNRTWNHTVFFVISFLICWIYSAFSEHRMPCTGLGLIVGSIDIQKIKKFFILWRHERQRFQLTRRSLRVRPRTSYFSPSRRTCCWLPWVRREARVPRFFHCSSCRSRRIDSDTKTPIGKNYAVPNLLSLPKRW